MDIQKAFTEADQTRLAFELPGAGHISRAEAINFVNVHTQRHVHQLKIICKSIIRLGLNMT
jgi:hypothetical protein